MAGLPSPLYISMWQDDTSVTEFLLQKLTVDRIREPGPDGLTPLTILFQQEKTGVIRQYFDKFETEEMARLSIAYGKLEFFDRALSSHSGQVDWINWIEKACRSNRVECVKHIKSQVGDAFVDRHVARMAIPYIPMRRETGLSLTSRDSFLTRLSGKFPSYNEATESQSKLTKSSDFGRISIKHDIFANVLDPFCPLATGPQKHVYKIRELRLKDGFRCPPEKHQG